MTGLLYIYIYCLVHQCRKYTVAFFKSSTLILGSVHHTFKNDRCSLNVVNWINLDNIYITECLFYDLEVKRSRAKLIVFVLDSQMYGYGCKLLTSLIFWLNSLFSYFLHVNINLNSINELILYSPQILLY